MWLMLLIYLEGMVWLFDQVKMFLGVIELFEWEFYVFENFLVEFSW